MDMPVGIAIDHATAANGRKEAVRGSHDPHPLNRRDAAVASIDV